MKKELKLYGLPHGCGAAVGNFIRSTYMAACSRDAIIGVSVACDGNSLGLFDHLPQDSVMVSDIVWALLDKEYAIRPEVLTNDRIVGRTDLGEIYAVSLQLPQVKQITTEQFSKFIVTETRQLVEFIYKQNVQITLYIMNVCGVMKESVSSTCLQELPNGSSNTVIPLACSGRRQLKCWFNIVGEKFTEDLIVYLEGNDHTFEDDYEHFSEVIMSYLSKVLRMLHPETSG